MFVKWRLLEKIFAFNKNNKYLYISFYFLILSYVFLHFYKNNLINLKIKRKLSKICHNKKKLHTHELLGNLCFRGSWGLTNERESIKKIRMC